MGPRTARQPRTSFPGLFITIARKDRLSMSFLAMNVFNSKWMTSLEVATTKSPEDRA